MNALLGWLSLVVAVLAFLLAFQADRRTRILSEPWDARRSPGGACILQNRTTRTLYDLQIALRDGMHLDGQDGDFSAIRPNGKVEVAIYRSPGVGDLFDVRWRRSPRGRQHVATLVLPPAST